MSAKNKKFKFIAFFGVFCAVSLFSVNLQTISSNVLGAEPISAFDGIYGSRFGAQVSELQDGVFLTNQNSGKNQYYSLDDISTTIFKGMDKTPSSIYVGYYYDKMQSIQYIYDGDIQVFDELEKNIVQEFNKKGKKVQDKNKPNEEIRTWCDSKPDTYIALYKIQNSTTNQTVLAVSNKKLTNEEINLDMKAGVPASVCYKER